jgi:ABC-2 type transport system permease protein
VVAVGLVTTLLLGITAPPAGAGAAVVSILSIALGQMILYYLGLVVNLTCFWLTTNESANGMYLFIQDLFSGALLPLWLFPAWFVSVSAILPFQSTYYLPLSLYVGQAPLDSAPRLIALQLVWCGVLAVGTRFMWTRAERRVVIQGG